MSKLLAGLIVALNIGQALADGVKFAGVNIAGFDFNCGSDVLASVPQSLWSSVDKSQGTCIVSGVSPPLGGGGGDGPGQMQHFTQDEKLNFFCLPVGWQYLVDNAGDPLNDGRFANYDKLVQACLQTGAQFLIDVHKYGR